jgi:hypothetical protein
MAGSLTVFAMRPAHRVYADTSELCTRASAKLNIGNHILTTRSQKTTFAFGFDD